MNCLTKIAATLAALGCSIATANAQCAGTKFFRAEGTVAGSVRFSRAVNDLLLPIGNEGPFQIAGLTTRIATNCVGGVEVWFEVYNSTLAGTPGTRIGHFKATNLLPTGRTFNVGGLLQAEILASGSTPAISPIRAGPGSHIWVGAYIRDTFSFLERGFEIADSTKSASIKLPMVRTTATGPWSSTAAGTCDLAIAARTVQYCPADFNRDGRVDSLDYDAFMAAWLARSPLANFDRLRGVTISDRTAFLNEYISPCATIRDTH